MFLLLSLWPALSTTFSIHTCAVLGAWKTAKMPMPLFASTQEDSIAASRKRGLETAGFEIIAHLSLCLFISIGLCKYEDYDCQALKPSVHLRRQAIKGMGEGYQERQQDWRQGDMIYTNEDISLIPIQSYNEIMEKHRSQRVPNWDRQASSDSEIRTAVLEIFTALDSVNELKIMADNYDWEEMRLTIRKPSLSSNLEKSCNLLRKSLISLEARNEIGFDWGSCAWRHCGAEADAQEALAELYNLIGVLEPFECRFILDVVERSLRDILAVVPTTYYEKPVSEYLPYRIRDLEQSKEESTLDEELLTTIEQFRNPQWDDE